MTRKAIGKGLMMAGLTAVTLTLIIMTGFQDSRFEITPGGGVDIVLHLSNESGLQVNFVAPH